MIQYDESKPQQRDQHEKYILRMKRHNSPYDFIRYLCRGVKCRQPEHNRQRNSEHYIQFCCDLYDKQDGKCALSGVAMTYSANSRSRQISIDRIDCSKGYTPGNTRLLCLFVNNALNSYDVIELIAFSRQVVMYHDSQQGLDG